MDENNFSFKNRLKNSSKLSQRSNISNKSLNSTNSNKPNIQNKRTKHLKYFDTILASFIFNKGCPCFSASFFSHFSQ